MYTLRRYHSPVEAGFAANWLIRNGVLARVMQGHAEALGAPAVGMHGGQHVLAIAIERDRSRAIELLDEFERDRDPPQPGWEIETEPDLARLPPDLFVRCPSCGENCRQGLANAACPVCREPLDPVALVVEQHGPEALADCYPQDMLDGDAPGIGDDQIDNLHLDCMGCRYSLDGLPRIGACPNCGRGYNKREIVEQLFGLND